MPIGTFRHIVSKNCRITERCFFVFTASTKSVYISYGIHEEEGVRVENSIARQLQLENQSVYVGQRQRTFYGGKIRVHSGQTGIHT